MRAPRQQVGGKECRELVSLIEALVRVLSNRPPWNTFILSRIRKLCKGYLNT